MASQIHYTIYYTENLKTNACALSEREVRCLTVVFFCGAQPERFFIVCLPQLVRQFYLFTKIIETKTNPAIKKIITKQLEKLYLSKIQ